MANNKSQKGEDYRSLNDQALEDRLKEEQLRLKKMKFAHAVNPIENPMALRATRKFIAQIKTEQHARKLAAK